MVLGVTLLTIGLLQCVSGYVFARVGGDVIGGDEVSRSAQVCDPCCKSHATGMLERIKRGDGAIPKHGQDLFALSHGTTIQMPAKATRSAYIAISGP